VNGLAANHLTRLFAVAAILAAALVTESGSASDSVAKEPLHLNLPGATSKGTPEDLPDTPTTEKPYEKEQVFMVPKGVKNVALGKPVASSVPPRAGQLSQITDGKKEATDDDAVEFKKGPQWVQVDLGASYPISAIAVWHDHRYCQAMHGVILQVSDDAIFKTNVTTLFNNDMENVVGQGAGTNREYFETQFGKIIDGKNINARYVRGYTKGSTSNSGESGLNAWEEMEVYALPK
jgi:hypothetical protein